MVSEITGIVKFAESRKGVGVSFPQEAQKADVRSIFEGVRQGGGGQDNLPLSKRGVTFACERVPNENGRRVIRLDEVAFTVSYDQRTNLPEWLENTGEIIRGNPRGYNCTFQLSPAGRLSVHTDDMHRMKAFFRFSGSDLQELDAMAILRHFSPLDGFHPTRLDVALDIYDAGLCAADIRELDYLAQIGDLGSSYRRARDFRSSDVSVTVNGETVVLDACTSYVGSRESERFLRFYDKGAEQGLIDDWKRLEMELKGPTAVVFVRQILENGLEAPARGLFRSFINPPVFWWAWAIEGEWVAFKGPGRKVSNTVKWLHTQVKKAAGRVLASERQNERVAAEKFILDIFTELDEKRAIWLGKRVAAALIERRENSQEKKRQLEIRMYFGELTRAGV